MLACKIWVLWNARKPATECLCLEWIFIVTWMYFMEKTVIWKLDLRLWRVYYVYCKFTLILRRIITWYIGGYLFFVRNPLLMRQSLKSKLWNHCLFHEVYQVTIHMQFKHICHSICISYAPNHMIYLHEHPYRHFSSLRVSSRKQKSLFFSDRS